VTFSDGVLGLMAGRYPLQQNAYVIDIRALRPPIKLTSGRGRFVDALLVLFRMGMRRLLSRVATGCLSDRAPLSLFRRAVGGDVLVGSTIVARTALTPLRRQHMPRPRAPWDGHDCRPT